MQRSWSRVFPSKNPPAVVVPIHAVSGEVGADLSKTGVVNDMSPRLDYDEFPDSIQSSPLTQLFDRFDTTQGGIEYYHKKSSRIQILKQLLIDLRKKLDEYEAELKQFETNLYQQQEYLTQKTNFLIEFQSDLNLKEVCLEGICHDFVSKDNDKGLEMVINHSRKVGNRFIKTFNQKIRPCQFGLKNISLCIKSNIDNDDEEFKNEEIKTNESIIKLLYPREYQEFLEIMEDVHEIYYSLIRLV